MVQFHQRLDGIWFVLARHGGRRDGGQVAHPPVHPQGTYIDIIGSPSVTHTHPHITHLVTPSIPFIPQFLSHPFFNPLFLTPSPTPSTTPSHVISYRIISSPLLSRQVSPRSGGDNNTHTFISHTLLPPPYPLFCSHFYPHSHPPSLLRCPLGRVVIISLTRFVSASGKRVRLHALATTKRNNKTTLCYSNNYLMLTLSYPIRSSNMPYLIMSIRSSCLILSYVLSIRQVCALEEQPVQPHRHPGIRLIVRTPRRQGRTHPSQTNHITTNTPSHDIPYHDTHALVTHTPSHALPSHNPHLPFSIAQTIEELMKEQKELEAEAAEEGKAPGVPQPQSSMYDSTFAQVTFDSRP